MKKKQPYLSKTIMITTFVIGFLVFNIHAEDKHLEVWETISTDDGFITEKKSNNDGLFSFRGKTTSDVKLDKILTVFFDPEQRKHWVDRFESQKNLVEDSKINQGIINRIYWIKFGLPWPISDRDYVLHITGNLNEQQCTMKADIKSVKHKQKPEEDNAVRAEAMGTHYIFKVNNQGKTELKVEVHTDPKGLLPNFLVNLIQKSWPKKTLTNLINHAKSTSPKETFTDLLKSCEK